MFFGILARSLDFGTAPNKYLKAGQYLSASKMALIVTPGIVRYASREGLDEPTNQNSWSNTQTMEDHARIQCVCVCGGGGGVRTP